ncbi:MAG: 2-oxo acid dehydrogenase subunit E2 [Saprospirales bacterium]|nr:MAG: 2-oxo acid dehydrogenase subunit E2 [Saprospirales bacterium]
MAKIDLIMPKMGESIMEATILKWLKKEGDSVDMDETILEIATDKVDSEIPSPVDGVITKILFPENEVVEIGTVIAHIATEGEDSEVQSSPSVAEQLATSDTKVDKVSDPAPQMRNQAAASSKSEGVSERDLRPGAVAGSDRFYSPLVRSIASKEGVTVAELESLPGTGMNGRVTKNDILNYLDNRSQVQQTDSKTPSHEPALAKPQLEAQTSAKVDKVTPKAGANEELIEMDRMRKMIAHHMVESKRISPHVTSFVEADVTNLVNWRNANKNAFQSKYGEKITFTPIFMEAVCKAIRDYPMINISVQGDHIIKKNNVNIGMATALPSGNLIVPVIKNADRLNLAGLAAAVNDFALRARQNKLQPDEIQGGTFSLTNVGTFGNVMGTPIIPQPQVAILATGAIRKRPAVVETEYGDVIAVRQMMFLSLSYDHRVVDGFLGGSFVRRVADYLEQFDSNRDV